MIVDHDLVRNVIRIEARVGSVEEADALMRTLRIARRAMAEIAEKPPEDDASASLGLTITHTETTNGR